MSSGDVNVQSAVHSVDQGRFAFLIRAGMFTVLVLGLSLLYILGQFRGLDHADAMDQAQIARNIAAGKGFTTDYIRPLALSIIQNRQGGEDTQVDLDRFPDFSQAPLNPWVNSFALRLVEKSWRMTPTDIIYIGDRVVATMGVIFFILSAIVWYFICARLFDAKLALYVIGAVLLTDLMWQFSLSGLPQMLALFLFSLACCTTIFAMEAAQQEQVGLAIAWIIGSGVLMGLMTLTHGLAVWIFLGWAIFAAIYFRPRGLAAVAAVAAYCLIVTPWLVRNYQVCGNPFGLSVFEAFYGSNPGESYLRENSVSIGGSGVSIQGKLRANMLRQVDELAPAIGTNIIAAAFFGALFHSFRNRKTFMFKWCVLLMWVCAGIGMALYPPNGPVSANQLNVLFVPLFASYGMAFLFVLWNRLEIGGIRLFRLIFIIALLVLCAIPMIFRFVGSQQTRIQWPPYVPPFIGILGDWFEPKEVICSDMPWAVSWYAQRKSLLLPMSVRTFNRIHDYNLTAQPITGLYLTPITRNARLFDDIYKGPYKDWAGLIVWPPQPKGFPLTSFVPLPIDQQCILFSDRERWNQPRNAP